MKFLDEESLEQPFEVRFATLMRGLGEALGKNPIVGRYIGPSQRRGMARTLEKDLSYPSAELDDVLYKIQEGIRRDYQPNPDFFQTRQGRGISRRTTDYGAKTPYSLGPETSLSGYPETHFDPEQILTTLREIMRKGTPTREALTKFTKEDPFGKAAEVLFLEGMGEGSAIYNPLRATVRSGSEVAPEDALQVLLHEFLGHLGSASVDARSPRGLDRLTRLAREAIREGFAEGGTSMKGVHPTRQDFNVWADSYGERYPNKLLNDLFSLGKRRGEVVLDDFLQSGKGKLIPDPAAEADLWNQWMKNRNFPGIFEDMTQRRF